MDEEDYREEYDDYDDDDDDDAEPSEHLILTLNDDGEAELSRPDEWVEVRAKDFDLITGFLDEHEEAWVAYAKKHRGEEDDEGGSS